MSNRRISLFDMPVEIMLIVEHASGVIYENQVDGVVCRQAEIEGVLAPIDIAPANGERIMALPYTLGRGQPAEIADAIDAVLASEPGARYLRVDRARLNDSREAWVFVEVDTPIDPAHKLEGPYWGAPRGFGAV